MRKPRPLRPGDRVVVPSPAGPVKDPDAWNRLEARLEARGYRVRVCPQARQRQGYLAGADADRLRDLQEALEDGQAAAVIPSRGGYGAMRLLRGLRIPDRRPPAFMGYSDVTALHMALACRGWVTFHGPMAACDLGLARPHGPSLAWLWALLEGEARPPLRVPIPSPVPLRGGRASGRLLGGNLTLLASLAGTGFLPDLRGAVLLLEEIGEAPYRVDRMLTQLRLAGCLEDLAALALGTFSYPGATAAQRAEQVGEVHSLMRDLAADLGVPALAGLPCGHGRENLALPLGTEVEIDTDRGLLVLREDWLER